MRRILIALALAALPGMAAADKFALGSMELKACAKGRERVTLVLDIEAPDFRRVQDELRACADHAVSAATLAALLKKLPAAEPAFWEEFRLCTRYTEWLNAVLSVHTSCR